MEDSTVKKTAAEVSAELDAAKRAKAAERKEASDVIIKDAKETTELKQTMKEYFKEALLFSKRNSDNLESMTQAFAAIAEAIRVFGRPLSNGGR
jgi:hypothetical protein